MLSKLFTIGVAVAGAVLMTTTAQAEPQRGGYGGGRDRIECSSNDYRYTRCDVDWRSADLVRQLSEARCIEGRTWGIDRRGLWVDRGCAGVFVERGRGDHHGGDWRPGPGWDRDISLTCSSDDYRYRMCQVDVGRGGGVRIVRQLSNSACIEGRSWGWNRAGVWVSGGCSAVFRIDRRWR
ncbi:DUF3011 domain-containing protein [Dokdonella immobilis]|uniref:DUF3011 domain-containing protein n=1 Tax=Dokdonella immobilis TaxID=578942 RepID=A0A1I4XFA1_9GAMM|nr:DUF3011 domain-containing protein [Dokdonella immobilis]SFN24342.1 Protein of unknown function [Dokdonella immobilis]